LILGGKSKQHSYHLIHSFGGIKEKDLKMKVIPWIEEVLGILVEKNSVRKCV
jgi:hypothetical protein